MRKILAALMMSALVLTACPAEEEPPEATPEPTPVATEEVSVYFVQEEWLHPVTREVPAGPEVGAEAMRALLDGPTPAEEAEGIGTTIPVEAEFLGFTLSDGIATVDLSREAEAGAGTFLIRMRVAQIVCTADALDGVSGVRIALDGELAEVFSVEGLIVDAPLTCGHPDFADLHRTEPPEEWPEDARGTVEAFMDARMDGLGADWFLTENARANYETHELALYRSGYQSYEIVSLEGVDAHSYEAIVEITEEVSPGDVRTFREILPVGPGEDLQGEMRPFVIRAAILQ